jgi:AcrR family transcriptional regulator
MNVVVRMFEQGGYEAVSIESTAQVLAISRATLYRAVPSKDDLVANVLDQTARELSRDVAAILKSRGLTGEERLDQLLRLQLDFAQRRPRCLVAIFWGADLPADVFQRLQAWRDEHERAWLRVIRSAAKTSHLLDDDPCVVVWLIAGLTAAVASQRSASAGANPQRLIDAAVRMILTGPRP